MRNTEEEVCVCVGGNQQQKAEKGYQVTTVLAKNAVKDESYLSLRKPDDV